MTRRETVLRAALAAYAVRVQPRAALSLIRTRTTPEMAFAAPDDPRGGGPATDCEESPTMASIPVHARHLHNGQHIVQHPDHPDRAIDYTVVGAPRLQTTALMEVDYRSDDGGEGRLVLDPIAMVRVGVAPSTPATTQQRAAQALVELTSDTYSNLPDFFAWSYDDRGMRANPDTTGKDAIPALIAWSNALGQPITWRPMRHESATALVEVATTICDVPVVIWDAIPVEHAERELPRAKQVESEAGR